MKSTSTPLTSDAIEDAVRRAIRTELHGNSGASPKRGLEGYPQRMRVDQVAAYLNCSENHVRNLFDEGKLTGINIGLASSRQTLRIFRESVASYEGSDSEGRK